MPGISPDPAAPTPISKVHPVPTSRAGERLDRFLTEVERSLSRSAVQQLIDAGCVRVNGAPARASRRVKVGDRIEVGEIGPVIGTHAGPRTIGVGWVDAD